MTSHPLALLGICFSPLAACQHAALEPWSCNYDYHCEHSAWRGGG